MYDESKSDALLSAVSKVATGGCVVQVSGHFAIYFDELGISVFVKDDTSDAEIRELKNKIAPVLAGFDVPFLWMVMFRRGGKSAGALFPDGLFTGAAGSPRVAIVLQPENNQLEAIASTMPVWAIESPSNRSVATLFWTKSPNVKQTDVGITLFKTADPNARYENFVQVLDTVEEHHWGLHQLRVFGLNLTEQITADLQVMGFGAFNNAEDGFIATKKS